jgi:predicted transcriptional regulator
MPVVEDGRAVGSVRETRILAKALANRELLESPVSAVMEPSFPIVDVDASSAEVVRKLQESPAVLVEEYGRITGIITRHDVLDTSGFNTAR